MAVTRGVARDCTLAFEGRRYSVPFRWVGRSLEVQGCAASVQVLAEGRVVATHPRHTRERQGRTAMAIWLQDPGRFSPVR